MTSAPVRHSNGLTPPNHDIPIGLLLALLMHLLLLLLGILFSHLNHRTVTPEPVQVQLWADGNSPVSPPRRSEPPKPQPEPEKTPEPPPPEPAPQAPPKTAEADPEIALQQAKKQREQEEQARQAAAEKERLEQEAREQAELKERKRLERERQAVERAAAEKAAADNAAAEKKAKEDAAKKAAAEKAAADKAAAEKAAAEKAATEKAAAEKKAKEQAAKKAAADKALKDMFRSDALGAAGIPGGNADQNQTGGAGGRDTGYGAKVRACVQPGVAYPTPPRDGTENPTAQYQVKLNTSNGQVTAVTITRSSGIAAFDRAIESGIRRCNPFPKPSNGRYEPSIYGEYSMY